MMTIPELMTYICFGLWLTGTATVFVLQLVSPINLSGKFTPAKDVKHHLMLMTVMSWLAMWCFRTMF